MSETSAVSAKKEPAIVLKGLTKIFTLGREKVVALNGIDLEVYPDEIICLLGTSGSGKSTLLNMMAGLEKPTKGSIVIFGERLDKMNERNLAMFRQKYMGFVFQSYNLLPNLSAIDNVSLPLAFRGEKKSIRTKKAKKMLKLVGLGKRMKHKPTQMSGGQQQRVGIARAFVGTPKIVFADEPTGNLDTRTTIEIMEMMVNMSRENHQTLIIVTHDIEIAAYADRIYHIIDGRISSVEDNRYKQVVPGGSKAVEAAEQARIAAAESVSSGAEIREAVPLNPSQTSKPSEPQSLPEPEIEPIQPIPENSGDESITEILENSALNNTDNIHTEEEK